MSHRDLVFMDGHHHSKVNFRQYLYGLGEPRDDSSRDTPAEMESELLENSYIMRRRFRHIAQDIRDSSL